jgi:transcriptional regulator with XRE-family HTH domain
VLEWSQRELAEAAEVSFQTVQNFEKRRHQTNRSTLSAIQRAFEIAGVKFIPAGKSGGSGVRLK